MDELQSLLGHRFADPGLLRQALAHSSLAGLKRRGQLRDFDRLEFLGDRVLGLIVADILVTAFPKAREGELGQRFAALVSYPSLAAIAREIDLGRFLKLAPSEDQGGGRRNPSVLADALEAVLGALYRDGGHDAARRFIHRHFLDRAAAVATPPREPKTALQEWAQARGLPLPTYRVVASGGPAHAPHYVVEVESGGQVARGEGAAKREAERAAASTLLDRLEQP
ncbi:MAG: ribonuclease III [Alphaproteobacteria bacterium]|nr:ribonuclease III [Alphaproteobacteria bacterium]